MSGTNKAILSMSVLLIASLVVYYGMAPPDPPIVVEIDNVQSQPKRPPVFGGDPVQKLADMGIPPVATALSSEPVIEEVAIWHPIPIDPIPVIQEPVVEIEEQKSVVLPVAVIESTYTLYTVGEGETLGQIAEDRLGSYRMWREIVSLNEISDPGKISPGDVLKMPKPKAAAPVVAAAEPASSNDTVFHTTLKSPLRSHHEIILPLY